MRHSKKTPVIAKRVLKKIRKRINIKIRNQSDLLIDLLDSFAPNEIGACQLVRHLATQQNALLDQMPKNALHQFAHHFAYSEKKQLVWEEGSVRRSVRRSTGWPFFSLMDNKMLTGQHFFERKRARKQWCLVYLSIDMRFNEINATGISKSLARKEQVRWRRYRRRDRSRRMTEETYSTLNVNENVFNVAILA